MAAGHRVALRHELALARTLVHVRVQHLAHERDRALDVGRVHAYGHAPRAGYFVRRQECAGHAVGQALAIAQAQPKSRAERRLAEDAVGEHCGKVIGVRTDERRRAADDDIDVRLPLEFDVFEPLRCGTRAHREDVEPGGPEGDVSQRSFEKCAKLRLRAGAGSGNERRGTPHEAAVEVADVVDRRGRDAGDQGVDVTFFIRITRLVDELREPCHRAPGRIRAREAKGTGEFRFHDAEFDLVEGRLPEFLGNRLQGRFQIVRGTRGHETEGERIIGLRALVVHVVRAPDPGPFQTLFNRAAVVAARAARKHRGDDRSQQRMLGRMRRARGKQPADVNRRVVRRLDVSPREPV